MSSLTFEAHTPDHMCVAYGSCNPASKRPVIVRLPGPLGLVPRVKEEKPSLIPGVGGRSSQG